MKLLLLALLLVAALPACTEAPASQPKRSAAERSQAIEAALAKTPSARTFNIGEHQLTVLNVPVSGWHGRVEYQTCLVWRDREFKTASMQCPGESSGTAAPAGPEPDPAYRP